jgi:uncharacterized protein (DUF1684 family)
MRLAPLAALTVALAGFALADSPPMPTDAETKWKAEIEDANEAYSKRPTAILKIDDAIYLKPGETAYLMDKGGTYHWSLSAPASLAPTVTASEDLKSATFKDTDGTVDLAAEGVSPHALSEKIRVSAGIAQIEPGKDGMRVAVYNDDNPGAAAFTGLDYYPYDGSFVVDAKFEPAAKLEPKVFQTSRGWYKQFYYAGDAVFSLKGKEFRLPMYAGSDKPEEIDSLAAFIMDDTTGKETYGVGRYVDVEVAKGALPKTVSIDFNFLYNPNCARSEHYNCPVAVDRVALPITAGEKKPAGH